MYAQKRNRKAWFLITVVILVTLACGTVNVELVTPTPDTQAEGPAAADVQQDVVPLVPASPTPVETATPEMAEDFSSLWMAYRDARYGYGVALPAHWSVYPTPAEGFNGTMSTASYDEAYYWANSNKGDWIGGQPPEGAVKLDFTTIEESYAGLTLAQAVTDILGRDELTVVLGTEEVSYAGQAAVQVTTSRPDSLEQSTTSVAFRLPSDFVLLVTPLPSNALQLADVQAILNSLVLSPETEVVLPTSAPHPPLESTGDQSGTPGIIEAVAWVGHVIGMPEGSQYDDFVLLSPSGVGEYGIAGATPELEAEIRFLRDAEGADEYVFFWGQFDCTVDDYNGCQLLVERIQRGATYTEDQAEGWIGTLLSSSFNSATSFVFQLAGDVPMWYSIAASQDPTLQSQIEELRDTGAVVQVWGTLLVGIPDVNGTRIESFRLEVLQAGSAEQPELPTGIDLTADWQTYLNNRYGYQFKYPEGAEIEEIGPQSFPTDEIPQGMSVDVYAEQLLKVYTDQLCIGIQYSLGYIYISAPPNAGARYSPCGRTGVGQAEIVPKEEEVLIDGRLYLAQGSEIIGAGETLAEHNETLYILLEDGTRIEYGALPSTEATYADYLTKTREILLRILSTYQPTVHKVYPSAAAEPGALPVGVACEPGFMGSVAEAVEVLTYNLELGNYAALKPLTANPLAIGYWRSESP
ncbi:MAG: hypothetical protein JW862_17190 [Anaerolineales bacterium]|nr:hypothetical protein [Anaerolineales bacterium]